MITLNGYSYIKADNAVLLGGGSKDIICRLISRQEIKEKLINHLVDTKNKRLSTLLSKNASYDQLK